MNKLVTDQSTAGAQAEEARLSSSARTTDRHPTSLPQEIEPYGACRCAWSRFTKNNAPGWSPLLYRREGLV